ncbi:hypothetical protein [Desulfosporosinus sp. Sb-LF]|nr:hypothetical protein [Desulfosporosinus sp. Sb-LF]
MNHYWLESVDEWKYRRASFAESMLAEYGAQVILLNDKTLET